MTDQEIAAAAAVYFGGRAQAAHVLTCDRCRVDDAGRHLICPNHPNHPNHPNNRRAERLIEQGARRG